MQVEIGHGRVVAMGSYLAVAEKLVPFRLRKRLAAIVFALDSIHPHVIVAGVDHEVEHAVKCR